MSYDPCNIATNSLKKVELSNTQSSAEIDSGPQEESNFWLSVFSKSDLYPTKLYSSEEVEYEDQSNLLKGANNLVNEFNEDRTSNENFDVERDNEIICLESLVC